jgi:hypothetical protein
MADTEQQPVTLQVKDEEVTSMQPSEIFFARLVGINEAASITGRNKGQISRDSNSKRLPYILGDKGQKRYKVADLYQIYGLQQPDRTTTKEQKQPVENNDVTIKNAVELAVMQERLHAQAETMRRMEQEIADLRQKQDKQLDTISRLTLLLPAPPVTTGTALAPAEPERSPEQPKRQPFWKKLFS